MRLRRFHGYTVLIALIGLIAGCSPTSIPRGVVKGRVTLKGQPITGAMIHFEDRSGGFEARVALDDNGNYVMKNGDGDGLPAGTYQVAVAPGRVMEPGEEVPLAGQGPKNRRPAATNIPKKYHATKDTDLSAEVKAGNNLAFDFELKP